MQGQRVAGEERIGLHQCRDKFHGRNLGQRRVDAVARRTHRDDRRGLLRFATPADQHGIDIRTLGQQPGIAVDGLGFEHLLRPPAARSDIDRDPPPACSEQPVEARRCRGAHCIIDPQHRRHDRHIRAADDRQHQSLIRFRIASLQPVEGRHLQPARGRLVARLHDAVFDVEADRPLAASRGERRERRALGVVRHGINLVPAAGHDSREPARRQLDNLVHPVDNADQFGGVAPRQPRDEARLVPRLYCGQQARRAQHIPDRVELDKQDAFLIRRHMSAIRAFRPVGLVEDAGARSPEMPAAGIDHPPTRAAVSRRPRTRRLAAAASGSRAAPRR